jgi:hypothetical protein
MSRCFLMTLVMLSVGLTCRAQSPDRGAGNSSGAKPAPQEGSNTGSTSATPSTPRTASTDKTTTTEKKPKKVWTNDEIGSVKGGISVVGDGKSNSRRPAEESHDSYDAHAELVRNYRDQAQKLREQIDAADSRIEQLKNFKGENTSAAAGINMNRGYNMVPVEEQVKQLEERKKKLRAKIDDLEVQAKKNGIDPGEVR